MNSLSQEITRQFYEWEQCGRGWFLYDDPVQLESPFEPFYYYRAPYKDDGKIDSLAVTMWKSLFGKKEKPPEAPEYMPAYFIPYDFENEDSLLFLVVTLPKDNKTHNVEMEQLLLMLSFCTAPISFEIIATASTLTVQFVCRDSDAVNVKNQIKAYFPSCQIKEQTAEEDQLFGTGKFAAFIDFGFAEEFMRPIATIDQYSIDPFTSLFGVLNNIEAGDQLALQVLFSGTLNAWSKVIVDAVTGYKGRSFFEDAPEMLPLAKEKTRHPLFAVTIRAMSQCDSKEKAGLLLQQLQTTIIGLSNSNNNFLVPLGHPHYKFESRFADMKHRQSRRLGMLMNSKELGVFVHFPGPGVIASKFKVGNRKTVAVPSQTKNDGILIGYNKHEGKAKEIRLTNSERLKHTHIIGSTGTGKSTLLLSMVKQDIDRNNGIAILDPHGDLIETILDHIPERRISDVILVDPADSEYPLGFNILRAHSDIEREVLSSDLVATFRRNSTSWGDQMNSVFANAIIAFLESSRTGTLADLRRFLIEKSFREEVLKTVSDPSIVYYWQKEFSLLKTNSIGPILTRLDTFLRQKLIRNMVCQHKGLDFEHILDSKKILLVKLSQGLIGAENSYLFGSLVVSKIHQAALARQAKQERNDFFFYMDEFQHFITPSMSAMLSGARKYHLGLVLAHQEMQQLQKYDSEVASSIIANAGTRICFRVGEIDAKRLADGFSHFESMDLQNLGTGEAIVRLERPELDFSLETIQLEKSAQAGEIKQRIRAKSRELYSTEKSAVENELSKSLQNPMESNDERYPRIFAPKEIITKEDKGKNKEIGLPIATGEIPKLKAPIKDQEEVIEKINKQKEESQHRYLQMLIKKMAESRSYKATIEAAIPNENGKVDVLLEGNEMQIACEVSVTTDATWELHNIKKCLAAGYSLVISCMTDRKAIAQLQKKIQESLREDQLQKIKVMQPEEFFNFLDAIAITPTQSETTMKGYRVKVSYDSITAEEMQQKRDSVARIVANSLMRKKK